MKLINFLNKLQENICAEDLFFNEYTNENISYVNMGCKYCNESLRFSISEFNNYSQTVKDNLLSILPDLDKKLIYSCDDHLKDRIFYLLVHNIDNDIDLPKINIICECKLPLWSKLYGFEDELIRIINYNCNCNNLSTSLESII